MLCYNDPHTALMAALLRYSQPLESYEKTHLI